MQAVRISSDPHFVARLSGWLLVALDTVNVQEWLWPQAGNTVLNSHSDAFAGVFRNLKDVRVGDLIKEKDVPNQQRIANARWISTTDDERLTLVTCIYPGAAHRLIVIARPLDMVYEGS